MTLDGNAFLTANNITLNVQDQIVNSGVIAADETIIATGNTIINDNGIITGSDVALAANEAIVNQSGTIAADNSVQLVANQVVNIAAEEDISQRRDNLTTVSAPSQIKAGDLSISADTFINTASDIQADSADISANTVLIGTQQNTTNLKEGRGSNYSNSQSTQHVGSNIDINNTLNITGDTVLIEGSEVTAEDGQITAQDLTVSATQDSQNVQMKSRSSGGLFGGSSSSSVTSSKVTNNQSSVSIANNLTINTNETQIIASEVKAKALEIETAILKLISQKDIDFLQQTSDSSGMLTRKITDKGHQQETVIEATIQAENITLNGQNINEALTPERIEQQILYTLSSQDTLTQALKEQGIDLQSLTANNKEWNESITTLSQTAQIAIQIAVTVMTSGWGTSLVGGTTMQGVLQQTIMEQAMSAALQGVVTQAAVQVTSSAITGNKLLFDVEEMAKSAAMAGAMVYVDYWAQWHTTNALTVDMDMGDYAQNAFVQGGIEGVKSELTGGDFEDGFKTGAAISLVSDAALQMRKYVVEEFEVDCSGGLSAGVRGDGCKGGGSHRSSDGKEIRGVTGGSQTGEGEIKILDYSFKYSKDGFINDVIEHYAGPHDFMSSWNYENYIEDGVKKTKLINDGWFNEVISGGLLIPSLPFAAAPAIQDNLDSINELKRRIDKDKESIEIFKNQGR